ncbi:MAG: hypothetical protein VZR24_18995 [Butyrivibrio hungatei]|nr:hypothetical protein [Butyrivibrio hungatei]
MTDFSALPDYMNNEELKKYFFKYLENYSQGTGWADRDKALKDLLALADRQWHTYELIDAGIKESLTKFLMTLIDLNDKDSMDAILTACCYLGLEDVYNFIVGNKTKITEPQALAVVLDTEKEIGDTISDPYSGMRG